MPSRSAVVGAFVLGALALGVAAILLFGGSRLFTPTARAVVFFEGSVAGLDVGAPVTFRGVRLGSVIRITLNYSPSTGTARIPVTIEVEPDRITWEGAGPDSLILPGTLNLRTGWSHLTCTTSSLAAHTNTTS